MSNYKLLSVGNNAKTIKGDGSEYVTAILYLAPADNLDGVNVCSMAEIAGCKVACLYTAGRGKMNSVQAGRLRKTMLWRDDREGFLATLKQDIAKFTKYCEKRGIQPVVRLNGTSDIMWENYIDMETEFPMVQFYDYTKIVKRAYKALPSNYHLTLSYSEANADYAQSVLQAHKDTGRNVAVVFREKDSMPSSFGGSATLDGDKDDLRFLDAPHSIVALYAKGDAKKDASGFVIDTH
tara:strand:- start:106 stop:816 length:711 start_codon:yes stop_codon:yes gene_type:complete